MVVGVIPDTDRSGTGHVIRDNIDRDINDFCCARTSSEKKAKK